MSREHYKIPREDWAIRKAALHMQAEKTKDDEEASQSDKSPKKTGWSGIQVCLMDKKKDISSKMKDDIILDNGSTLSIFANPELVEGICKSKSTLEMAMNAGTQLTNQEANVTGFGPYGTTKEPLRTFLVSQNWWISIESHSTQAWKMHFWSIN